MISSSTLHQQLYNDALTEIRRRLAVSEEVESDGTMVDTHGLALVLEHQIAEMQKAEIEEARKKQIEEKLRVAMDALEKIAMPALGGKQQQYTAQHALSLLQSPPHP